MYRKPEIKLGVWLVANTCKNGKWRFHDLYVLPLRHFACVVLRPKWSRNVLMKWVRNILRPHLM